MDRFLFIGLAGAAGTWVRYGVGLWAGARWGAGFPWGTLMVNLAGCFLMGLVMHFAVTLTSFSPNLRYIIASGFLGGLTTYSSFNYEALKLALDGAWGAALGYFALTLVGCLLSGLLGLALAVRLVPG